MSRSPDWNIDGKDWPNRVASRFVQPDGLTWHVQIMGQGPVLLLVHGTGAATHSWRDLAPMLATNYTVVAPDLPGHGFTTLPASHRLSLRAMADGLAALLDTLDLTPEIAIGHSAGAAILARMCLDGRIAPKTLISLNGALLPIGGVTGTIFSSVAQTLVALPLVPSIFAWRAADRRAVIRLLDGTGSKLDPAGIEFYARLFRHPGHVAGALGMMANWDLHGLQRDLPTLATPLTLVAAAGDLSIPPAIAARVAAMVPGARLVTIPGLGHLAHEEAPVKIKDVIEKVGETCRPPRPPS